MSPIGREWGQPASKNSRFEGGTPRPTPRMALLLAGGTAGINQTRDLGKSPDQTDRPVEHREAEAGPGPSAECAGWAAVGSERHGAWGATRHAPGAQNERAGDEPPRAALSGRRLRGGPYSAILRPKDWRATPIPLSPTFFPRRRRRLLHRHRLGKISRLVHVAVARNGDVIG